MQLHKKLIAATLATTVSIFAMSAYAMTAQEFVTKASIANKFEIDTSKVALNKSADNDVKTFAQQMVDDHGKTGDKLKDVLKTSKSDAKPAKELDEKHQEKLDKLNKTPKEDFDEEYIAIQSDAHNEAVKLFADYSNNGDNEALKKFATETLPTLKAHKKHVETLKSKH